ncbi:class I SAM-dependent methyltransferase [Streptomyces sp. O3]
MQHTANTEQAQAWNGYEGAHWARNQDRWDAVNEGFNEPLFTAAAIKDGDLVLDVGCGAGYTTRLAARRAGSGRAQGLDLSGPMLARARESAEREGVGNVSFEQGDAQVHPLPRDSFDVAISRFGMMFFADPVAAFANIRRALRPGGRVAFICAAEPEGNQWLQALTALRDILPLKGFGAPGGPGMFSLAERGRAQTLLADAGFTHVDAAHVAAYGTWGRDADDAAAFMLNSGPGHHAASQVSEEARRRARQRLTDTLRAYEQDGTLRMRGTAWLLTASRPE